MAFVLSYSQISDLLTCPRKYQLAYLVEPKLKVPKWIRTVYGGAIHRTLQSFYRTDPKVRIDRIKNKTTEIFPISADSAKGVWFHIWQETLKEERADSKIVQNPCKIRFEGKAPETIEKEQWLWQWRGAAIVEKYWQENHGVAFPEMIEEPFWVPTLTRDDVWLNGVIDQVRRINGKAWIVDLKTEWQDFGEEDARAQFPLHQDIQFTIYSWGYRMKTNETEIGILHYPLGYKGTDKETGEKIDKYLTPTFREADDFRRLEEETIAFFINVLEGGIFPRRSDTKHYCSRVCDYVEVCNPSNLYTTKPIPTSQFNWGKVDKKKVLSELAQELKGQVVYRPRLKLRKRRYQ